MMIDLHIHSTFSDGTCSVEEIIEQAKQLKLTQIAITDHNTLEGSIYASTLGGIDIVVGSELSADYKGHEVHLLCYFPNGSDYKNVRFLIKEAEANKQIALMAMIENLNNIGIDINIKELAEFGKGTLNRVHICKAMIKHGYIESVAEGFKKYIGDDCPAYVGRKKTTIEDAIEAVHDDGGICVIAHPYEYTKYTTIEDLFKDVLDLVDGIECFHPSADKEGQMKLYNIAIANNKIITGGSDFHGTNKPNNFLNMMEVDDKYQIKRN